MKAQNCLELKDNFGCDGKGPLGRYKNFENLSNSAQIRYVTWDKSHEFS